MGCVAVKTQTRKVGGGAVCREDRRRSTTLRPHLEATERSLLLREPRGLCCCCCHSSLRLLQDSTVQQQQPRHHSTSRAPAFHGPFCSGSSLSEKGPAQSASQLLARPRAPLFCSRLPAFVRCSRQNRGALHRRWLFDDVAVPVHSEATLSVLSLLFVPFSVLRAAACVRPPTGRIFFLVRIIVRWICSVTRKRW
jgi:hypothetical protein